MSSLSSLYNSLTGLTGFTKALDNLSNNVANLNTPGYKGRDVFYRELAGGNPERGIPGNGVQVDGGSVRFSAGDSNATGNSTDLFIDGNGFFILRDGRGGTTSSGTAQTYTRAGQFTFGENGFLIDASTEKRVAGITVGGKLTDINIQDHLTSDPIVTSLAKISGSLSSTAAEGTTFPADDQDPIELSLFDSAGRNVAVHLSFEKLDGTDWQVMVTDTNGVQLASTQTLEFSNLGNAITETETFLANIQLFDVLEQTELSDSFKPGGDVEFTEGTPESGSATTFTIEDAFFIIRDEGDVQFSNTGTYQFDDKGFLVDPDTGFRVAARTDSGKIEDFSIKDALTTPAASTTKVNVTGNLDASVDNGVEIPPEGGELFTIEVMSPEGEIRTIQLQFLKESSTSTKTAWSVIAMDADGNEFGTNDGSVSFNLFDADDDALNGEVITNESGVTISYVVDGQESFDFDLVFTDEDGVGTFTAINEQTSIIAGERADGKTVGELTTGSFDEKGVLTVNYSNGDAEVLQQIAVVRPEGEVINDVTFDFSGVTTNTTPSEVEVADIDGRSKGLLVDSRFDENGQLILTYSNEDVVESDYVALAHFSDLNDLISAGDTQFRLTHGGNISIGRPNDEGLGKIKGGFIELSNVELSREFADIIIVQRGYQASSQVLNVTNQILEELYNSVKGR
ncbi:hypothetical protein A9Q81_07665 [Gammaproteobacteria bacterium 42_54_T18]|nr:hypothetical protein A9Q81_07665 [Gammaproteobacteria bacterium 42_54_T18]